ncbi:MAG: LLM class flavin-dependent oxidoreductase [Candidatus Heimdallarchaeota archaeon]|nr:LLM class flavin-dependent oxidoreductase [Candidatus Heimdallarchaeota archaeon]MCK4611822.1 LLM class flavin-dependent oxidoreductase [Candidatus Heimdallarchaeota archaeon]
MNHRLRFGVITIQNESWDKLVERWKFIEEVGFDSVWVADHFVHWNKTKMTFFEAWTTLSALACHTSKIRIGTGVSAMHWRHPAWLAKQALTVDHISNGRLELGLGAGGSGKIEYTMTGIEAWEPGEKVKRFREYVEIIDKLLTNPVTTYHGKYYQLEKATMQPDPIQKPRPPITIGAHKPLMLKLTARYADSWNTLGDISALEDTIETLQKQNDLLDEYCEEIGRDPQTLRRTFGIYESEAMHNIGPMKLYSSPEILEDIVKKCHEIGITEITFPYPFVEDEIPAFEKLSQEVIPELRKLYS